jgi:hypothetical protein
MPIRPEMRHHYMTPEWRALSLRIRKERAQDRCECTGQCGTDHGAENAGRDGQAVDTRCSAFEGQPHPVTGSIVRLTVAHLDQDPANSDDANLLAACQRCHNRIDQPYRKQNAHRTRRGRKAAGDLFEAIGDG